MKKHNPGIGEIGLREAVKIDGREKEQDQQTYKYAMAARTWA
jgi:hypothetical protein